LTIADFQLPIYRSVAGSTITQEQLAIGIGNAAAIVSILNYI
jgi:hypothetical protein